MTGHAFVEERRLCNVGDIGQLGMGTQEWVSTRDAIRASEPHISLPNRDNIQMHPSLKYFFFIIITFFLFCFSNFFPPEFRMGCILGR